MVTKEFRKENQSKSIQYIDLEKYHSKNKPSEKDKKDLFERNKNIFFTEFKSIQYAEITPEKISGSKDYNESFFKKLDFIENNVLDGKSFDEIIFDYNLETIKIKNINSNKENINKKKSENISDELFEKIYNLASISAPEIVELKSKYYLAEITANEKKTRPFSDPEVQKALNAQLNFKNKIESNTSIIKEISIGSFNKEKFNQFAKDNLLKLEEYKINSLKQNDIFSEGIIRRIFLTEDGKINLITNNTLTKSFLILAVKTNYKVLKKDSNEYEKYEAKARLNLINSIYQSHDRNLNEKYKVEYNQRTIERVKNSF